MEERKAGRSEKHVGDVPRGLAQTVALCAPNIDIWPAGHNDPKHKHDACLFYMRVKVVRGFPHRETDDRTLPT